MLPRHALLVLCVAATLSYCRGGRRTGRVPDYDVMSGEHTRGLARKGIEDYDYSDIGIPPPDDLEQDHQRSFIKPGSTLSPEDRFRITRECLDKPVSESPWVTQVEGFCGEITCEISETVQSKAASLSVKICPPADEGFRAGDIPFPDCCSLSSDSEELILDLQTTAPNTVF